MENSKLQWCIDQHKQTNHMYDTYLPYEFHLRMVGTVALEYGHLLEMKLLNDVILAAYGHDLIEDTRVSYNDVKSVLGPVAADIIYAVTNEKGKNRKERANERYYEGIRNTSGAVFVKLCDRIANVQYSKMTKSRMFEMYKKENDEFMVSLGFDDTNQHPYFKMFSYLVELLKE